MHGSPLLKCLCSYRRPFSLKRERPGAAIPVGVALGRASALREIPGRVCRRAGRPLLRPAKTQEPSPPLRLVNPLAHEHP
jgi:hypothetical protein